MRVIRNLIFFNLLLVVKSPLLALESLSPYGDQREALLSKISEQTYQAYIRPQMGMIIDDFYRAYGQMAPAHSELLELKNTFEKMLQLLEKIQHNKDDLQDNDLAQLPRLVDELEVQILGLMRRPKEDFIIDSNVSNLSPLEWQQHLFRMLLLQWEIKQEVLTATQLFGASGITLRNREILNATEHFTTYLNLQLFAHFPANMGHQWAQVHHDFVKSLELLKETKKNKQEFLLQLEKLNISWHFFHQLFSGIRERQVFETSLHSIQSRWNTILRLIF